MIECSGRSLFVSGGAEAGKLCFVRSGDDASCGARILIISGGEQLRSEDMRGVVGLVFLCESTDASQGVCEEIAHFLRLPAIALSEHQAKPLQSGRIAIIDSAKHKLYIDPDIETVKEYFKAEHSSKKTGVRFCLHADPNLLFQNIPDIYDGIVLGIPSSAFSNEQMIYEHFCDAADKFTGMRIVSVISFDSNENAFMSAVRGLYRASVWGRFSLLFTNIRSPEDASKCARLIRDAICQLIKEGRETNAAILKGAVIDTPLMLIENDIGRYFDFLCADFQRLRFFLSASPSANAGEEQTVRHICNVSAGTRHFALTNLGNISREALDRLLTIKTLDEIYVSNTEYGLITDYK